jgi:hypothetical protein
MTIIGSPERKNFKHPNLHNYTFKSRASRQDHFEEAVQVKTFKPTNQPYGTGIAILVEFRRVWQEL